MENQEFYRRLRRLIGRQCRYLDRHCVLLEVLAEEASLVLRCSEGLPPIQGDQFGQALRRAEETLQIPLFDTGDGDTLSAELLDILHRLEADAA